MAAMQDDPRWIEHQQAAAAVKRGDEQARERYRKAMLPYARLLAGECCEVARVPMMETLLNGAFPWIIVAAAFKPNADEEKRLMGVLPVSKERD